MSVTDLKQAPEPNVDALAPGSRLLSGQYEILRYLSSGGFGITYLARDSLNRTVVIKECFPEAFCARVNKTVCARTRHYIDDFQSIVKLFIREAHALSRLKHPSVVGVHQVFEDNETAYMALDLVEGKDLLEIIETGHPAMSPDMVQGLTLKLLDAIGHVHSQDLLHRDISPDNILVDTTGHPVLIDFGAAREEASRKSRVLSSVLVVKDGYSPQEFYVAGSPQHPCSDLYAMAATLVHLISGAPPPNSQARLAALAGNQQDLYTPLSGRFPDYDTAFLEAIDKALNIVPSERLQSAEDWALMIDHTKRIERARAQAQNDRSIDQTVMNLVKSANAEQEDPCETGTVPPARPDGAVCADKTPTAGAAAPFDTCDLAQGSQSGDAETSAQGMASPEVENLSVTAEDIARPHPEPDAAPQDRPKADTPYVRVTSRALEAAKSREATRSAPAVPSKRMNRFATVPIVFCAYLFYGYTVLQYDAVQAATVQPLLAWGQELGQRPVEAQEQQGVTIRHGEEG